jgi:aconitase A
MPHNLHNTLQSFKSGKLYSIPALGKALNVKVERLPVSIRIVLESVLRNCDGKKVTEEHVRQLANWKPNATRTDEMMRYVGSRLITTVLIVVMRSSPMVAAARISVGLTFFAPATVLMIIGKTELMTTTMTFDQMSMPAQSMISGDMAIVGVA